MNQKARTMKRCMALLLVVVMCLSLMACNGKKEAFEASKAVYDNICTAYEIIEEFGKDVYEAWVMGIYDADDFYDEGVYHLTSKTSVTKEELPDGYVYAIKKVFGEEMYEEIREIAGVTGDDKEAVNLDNSGMMLRFLVKEMNMVSLFTFIVYMVIGVYEANGKIDKARVALDNAKVQMKELSEKYGDYEHYSSLKGFYTTATAFFDYCQNPTGSFDQMKDTVNEYQKEARDYINDLNYAFED